MKLTHTSIDSFLDHIILFATTTTNNNNNDDNGPQSPYSPLDHNFFSTLDEIFSVGNNTNSPWNITYHYEYPLSKIEKAQVALVIPTRVLLIIIAIFLFIGCFLLRNKQPLKSRSVLPFLTIIMSIGSSIGIIEDCIPEFKWIRNLKTLVTYKYVWCFIRTCGIYPMFVITLVSYIMLLSRYFLLKAIMRRKEQMALKLRKKNKEQVDELTEFDIDLDGHDEEMSEVSEMTMVSPRYSRASISPATNLGTIATDTVSEIVTNTNDIPPSKNTSSSSLSAEYTSSKILNVLEFCVSKKAITVVVIVALLIWYFVVFLVVGLNKLNCPPTVPSLTLGLAVLFLIVMLIFPIILGFDLVTNIELIKRCKILEYLLYSDPLYYRLEMWMIAVFGICSLGSEIIVTCVLPSFKMDEATDLSRAVIRTYFFDLWCMFLIVPGIALTLSFRNWILEIRQRRYIHKQQLDEDGADDKNDTIVANLAIYNPSEATIRFILKKKETCELFRDYVRKELSLENMLFIEDIVRYKRIPNRKQKLRFKKAKAIVDLYLRTSSKLEVNVSQTEKTQVLETLEQYNSKTINQLPLNLFKELQGSVVKNLIDSYSRFFHSSAFQNYIKTIEA